MQSEYTQANDGPPKKIYQRLWFQLVLCAVGVSAVWVILGVSHVWPNDVSTETVPTAAPAHPDTFLSVQPYFTILNMTNLAPFIPEFTEHTKADPNVVFYAVNIQEGEQQMMLHEGYTDGAALKNHIDKFDPAWMTRMEKAGAAKVERFSLLGPADQLEGFRETFPDATFFPTSKAGWFTNMIPWSGPDILPEGIVQNHPFFDINPGHEEEAEAIMAEFVIATKSEPGCLYYSWHISDDRTTARCREAYADAKALQAHLGNVGHLIEKLTTTTNATNLTRIEVHGPKEQVELMKQSGVMPSFATYYAVDEGGFRRYRMNY